MATAHKSDPDTVRLDIWLWAARFFRTRSLAKQAIEGGKVEVNGDRVKPSRTLHVGEEVVVQRGLDRYEVIVVGLSHQRGPAPVAQLLYSETEASRIDRERMAEQRRLGNAGFPNPSGRPDKHSRKQLRDLKEGQGG
ncbi:MAG: S4 domain-containing protein [Dokdonella sp.]